MLIRKADNSDIEPLARLMGELGYPTTFEEMKSRFNNISKQPMYNTQVVEHDGKVIGMIGMLYGYHYEKNNHYIRIVALVVDSNYRKQGVGEQLLNQAENWANELGANRLVLNSGNRDERDEAHQFYLRRGFEPKATGFYKSW